MKFKMEKWFGESKKVREWEIAEMEMFKLKLSQMDRGESVKKDFFFLSSAIVVEEQSLLFQ